MLSGVDLGTGKEAAKQMQAQLSAGTSGTLEVWPDDLTAGKNGQYSVQLNRWNGELENGKPGCQRHLSPSHTACL
ncbi:hypothetical protein [Fibrella forsythiae]|uniref:Uncharacterized protein n=1 Tax=Fibrella forsythiae TaxID=2817061 RepID=A0ABS3JGM9_9BACT|nr:hypothetical protein [Fibrella forsythiae]MBO0949166.1 hypothetical protein [Fibrella forsythiae]